jgi:hypothetical protein
VAPAVGGRLLERLGRGPGHLALEGGDEEPGDEHDHRQGHADEQSGDLEAGADQGDGDQGGGDEPSPAGQLDPPPGEAQKGGKQGEGGGHRHRHHRGGTDGEALDEAHAHEEHAEQGDHHGHAGEEHRPPGGVDGDGDRLPHPVAGPQLLAVAGGDEQGVVDAHPQADHDAEEGGEVGDGEDVAQKGDEGRADADPEEGHAHGKAHGQHRAEGDDEDDHGEGHAQDLRGGLLELGEDGPAQLDAQARDPRGLLEDLLADLVAAVEVDVVGQLDVGEGDLPGLGPPRRDLLGGALGVRALHPVDVLDRGHLVEERLHRLADGRILDALVGAEDDRADHPGAQPAEVRVEDVEAGLRLAVGQVELVAEPAADRVRDGAAEKQKGQPQTQDELAVVVAPGTDSREHHTLPLRRTLATRA